MAEAWSSDVDKRPMRQLFNDWSMVNGTLVCVKSENLSMKKKEAHSIHPRVEGLNYYGKACELRRWHKTKALARL